MSSGGVYVWRLGSCFGEDDGSLSRFLTAGCVGRFATEEALDEIYRVLKEGAVFGMIWNIDDCETVRGSLSP